jgi:serine/threonine protein kinase
VIFVNGQPKLADIGLVAEIRTDKEGTWVGTPGFMPPAPEPPGTPAADIYGLGMVLYVIRTGRNPARFPELSTTLVERTDPLNFVPLNNVILKACQPDIAERYGSARELHAALLEVQKALEREETGAALPSNPRGE